MGPSSFLLETNMATATAIPPTKVTPADSLIQLLVEKHQQLRNKGKQIYTEADQVFEQIREQMNVGQRIHLSNGRVFEFVDNYATSNVCFRPAGVKRFELVEVTKSKLSRPAS